MNSSGQLLGGWITSMCRCSFVSFSIASLHLAGTYNSLLLYLCAWIFCLNYFSFLLIAKMKVVFLWCFPFFFFDKFFRGIFLNLRARSMALTKAKWKQGNWVFRWDNCTVCASLFFVAQRWCLSIHVFLNNWISILTLCVVSVDYLSMISCFTKHLSFVILKFFHGSVQTRELTIGLLQVYVNFNNQGYVKDSFASIPR